MKTVASFISGFVLATAVSAIAVETSNIGRYQVSTTMVDAYVYEIIIDTTTGKAVDRKRVNYKNYQLVR